MNQHEKIQQCKNIFVTWFWLIGIIFFLSIPAITLSFNYGKRTSKVEAEMIILKKDISVIERMESKIDTILSRVK